MDQESRKFVESIHAARGMMSLVIAGAGTQAIGAILGVAGASRTVLDIQVPYASSALVDYIGVEPEQYVSPDAARALAKAAYFRAVDLREDRTPVAGVACTATIATDRPKRGDHRCHVAVYDPTGWRTESLTFVKGLRSREEEDAVASRIVLNSIARSCGIGDRLDLGLVPEESVHIDTCHVGDPLDALTLGHVGHVLIDKHGVQSADTRFVGGIVSGSFNPRHRGHDELALVASRLLDAPSVFELSISNVDKPELKMAEIRRRTDQFLGEVDMVVTRAPTFYEKARLLPGCTFIIGVDTMVRLVDSKYYDGSSARMMSSLLELRSLGCSFLVAGRAGDQGFMTLDDVDVPADLADLFTSIPESAFREDVSSTQVRTAGTQSAPL